VLDVEGDAEVVKLIYADIKDALVSRLGAVKPRPVPERVEGAESAERTSEEQPAGGGRKAKSVRRKRSSGSASNSEARTERYSPALEKNLKVPGLKEFYDQFSPKSHSEKVLIFAHFLNENGYNPCTANQIFTCYKLVGIERPKAFRQAIIDAHGSKFGYIDYKSVDDISVTTIGEEHLSFKMTKNSTAE